MFSPFRSHGFALGFAVSARLRFALSAVRYSMEHTFDYTVTLFSPLAMPISEHCLLRLLLTSHSSLLLRHEAACEISRDKPASLSSSTCLIYAYGLRLPLGLHCILPAYPPHTPYYQVSIRQATISLSLLLTCTSRCKPWVSLWGSSATTPLVDFHHRLTACPSYKKARKLSFPRRGDRGRFSVSLNHFFCF